MTPRIQGEYITFDVPWGPPFQIACKTNAAVAMAHAILDAAAAAQPLPEAGQRYSSIATSSGGVPKSEEQSGYKPKPVMRAG